MPEMTFELRWPDGRMQSCYSPSLVVHDHLSVGSTYTVAELDRRTREALAIASERVRARFGFACSAASATAEEVAASAAGYGADEPVTVTRMTPPAAGTETT